MIKNKSKLKSGLMLGRILFGFFVFTLFSSDVVAAPAAGDTVVAGTDYLHTNSAQLCMPGAGCYEFKGNPGVFGPNGYDTLVQRSNITVLGAGYGNVPAIGPLTNINITGLSLYSSALNLYATLHPVGPGYISAGNMNIYDGSTGTKPNLPASTPSFTSKFNVWVDLCDKAGINGVGCLGGAIPKQVIFKTFTLQETAWTSSPTKGYLKSGPIGDVTANYHFDLSGNYLPQGNLTDFYIPEPAIHDDGAGGFHSVDTMPEINGGVLPKGLSIIAGVFIMLFGKNKSVTT